MAGLNDGTGGHEVDQLVDALTRDGVDDPENRILDRLVGRWHTFTEWEPVVGRGIRRSEGEMEAGWILRGRSLELTSRDTEREEVARVMLAFDPSASDYVAFSATVLSSFFGIERGHYDPAMSALWLDGSEPAPAISKVIAYRRTFRFLDPDTFTVDISYPGAPPNTYGPMLITNRRAG